VSTSSQQAAELHGGALGGSLRDAIVVVAFLAKEENEVLDHGKPNSQMIRGRLG
jgi:hypothetical protein